MLWEGDFVYFCQMNYFDMEIFIAAVIVMMSLTVATFQVVRNVKYRELAERKHWFTAVLLYMESLLVMCDLWAGGRDIGIRLATDVMLALTPMSLLSSSLWSMSSARKVIYGAGFTMTLMAMFYVLGAVGLSEPLSFDVYVFLVLSLSFIYVLLFFTGVWFRVREVRAVMQAGTVWAGISFIVDAAYALFVISEILVLVVVVWRTDDLECLVALCLGGALAGYGIRVASDSLFVLMRRHERRILESMKISPVEVSGMGTDDMYKDIYERVLEYFDRDKPFLNGDLTIQDLVSVVFSNKLYISRAISQHTGRNFCQFVNYHRVMYSVECFRRNTDLKVTELWSMCGFNTIVSYNMAFKLFMGENPSDWCRKEKIRLYRKSK